MVRPRFTAIFLTTIFASVLAARALAGDSPGAFWPGFRGPLGSGVAERGDLPVHFGPEKNVTWRTPLAPGHSSPCIVGDRVFLTTFEEGKLATVALDRATGHLLWERRVLPTRIEQGSRLSNPAASTPTADRERLIVYFGSFGLLAYDHEGRELWRKPMPTPVTQHGASTSPVLANDRVVLACDQDVGSHLLAVDVRSGETIWRAERPGFRRGFSTPILWPLEQPTVAILPGTLRLVAYDLATGRATWHVRGLPNEMVSSPAAGEGLIFSGGWTYGSGVDRMPEFDPILDRGDRDGDGRLTREEAPAGPARQHFVYIDADKDGFVTREEWESLAKIFDEAENALLAVRPGGHGDVTATHVMWRQTRGLPYVPSPLLYRGRLFLVKKGGIASCFDARTGEPFYHQERVGALGGYYASPIAAGGKICIASERGEVVILRAADTLEILARNDLREPILATPAVVGSSLYVRTEKTLFAFCESPSGERNSPR